MSTSISCIIPAYNCQEFIHRSLHSVLNQTLPPDEILVIDDASTDATPQLLASYGDRIRVLTQDSNTGPAAARNRGIQRATGRFICFQDADDEWHPDKLAWQMDYFVSHPATDASVTHIRNEWSPNLRAERHDLKDHDVAAEPAGYVFQTLLARRRVFDTVGLLNERLRTAEDVEWYSRARDAGIAVAVLPKVLVTRHLHGGNLSEQVKTTASERYDDLLNVLAARLKSKQPA